MKISTATFTGAAVALALFATSCITPKPTVGDIVFNGTEYIQTFYDDFEEDKLNTSRWERCPEWERQDRGGYWKDSDSYIQDGNLVIEARSGETLESGAVRTKGKFEQKGGLYQIRFKVEKASGLWYAFWLMSDKEGSIGNGAIDGGEIDIFELVPNQDPYAADGKINYLNSAVHWDGYGDHHQSKGSQWYYDDSFYDEWHTVTFEWTDNYYKAYLDDSKTPYWSTVGQTEAYGGIVKSRNYIKLTAEFGSWAKETDYEALPAHMYVDWVKVYKAVK